MSKTTEKPDNWTGFMKALAETDVPSDFLTPEDRQQGGCGVTSETEYQLQLPVNAAHLKQSIEQYGQGLTKQDADAVKPPTVKLGTLLAQIGRELELTDDDCKVFDDARDRVPT